MLDGNSNVRNDNIDIVNVIIVKDWYVCLFV